MQKANREIKKDHKNITQKTNTKLKENDEKINSITDMFHTKTQIRALKIKISPKYIFSVY